MLFPGSLSSRFLLPSIILLLAVCGCSSNEKQVYPAQGRVVWEDGVPVKELAGGMVIFQCDTEQISAKAPIDAEGRFVLGTYGLDDGAVAGKHKVAIVQPSDEESGDYKPLAIVAKKYESMETSDLEVTVQPQQNDIELKVLPGAWMKKQKK
jgi:hypothetical protein